MCMLGVDERVDSAWGKAQQGGMQVCGMQVWAVQARYQAELQDGLDARLPAWWCALERSVMSYAWQTNQGSLTRWLIDCPKTCPASHPLIPPPSPHALTQTTCSARRTMCGTAAATCSPAAGPTSTSSTPWWTRGPSSGWSRCVCVHSLGCGGGVCACGRVGVCACGGGRAGVATCPCCLLPGGWSVLAS